MSTDTVRSEEAAEPQALSTRRLSAGSVGNILEWYDFGLYGFMASIISELFFPSSSGAASLLGTFGIFAAGFLMRPIGGLVLGHIGDRWGRTVVLVVSVVMMGGATTAIGFLPDYRSIGLWAPILLLVIRLVQGLSVGGEFSGSVTYMVETAPEVKRGFAGSFANVGSIIGTLLGSGAAALTTSLAPPELLHDWVWRVPFLAGGVLAIFAYFLRSRLQSDTKKPKDDDDGKDDDKQMPIVEAFTKSRRQTWLSILFTSGYGIVFYITLVYLPTFAEKQMHLSSSLALKINLAGLFMALLVVPVAGWLSDKVIRRRRLLLLTFIATGMFGWAGFKIIVQGWEGLLVGQLMFGALQGVVLGVAPAMLVELFPGKHRLSGYSAAYNLGLGIAGGTAPLVVTALIEWTGNKMMAGWYLVFASLLAVIAVYFMHDRSREPLR